MPNGEVKILVENVKTRIVPHGWREAGIYLLTLNVNGRKPLLGRLEGTPEKARIEATDLGVRVSQEIQHISSYYPQIQVLAKQLMPDHLHVVLYVKEPLPVAIGLVVRGLKQGCNRAVREIAERNYVLAAMQSPSGMTGNKGVYRGDSTLLIIQKTRPHIDAIDVNSLKRTKNSLSERASTGHPDAKGQRPYAGCLPM